MSDIVNTHFKEPAARPGHGTRAPSAPGTIWWAETRNWKPL